MTDKRPTPDQSAGKGRRKRAAPTIDLKATDLTANEAPPLSSVDEPPVAAQATAAPESHPESRSEPEPHAASPSHGDAGEPPKTPKPQPAWLVLAAGVAGAAVMCAVLVVFWLAGFVPNGDSGNARIAGLEAQVQELRNRPAPAPDTGAVNTLAQRVARMEESLTKLPAGDPAKDAILAERVAAADAAMKSLGVALTALNRRNDELAANTAQARERAEAAEKAVAGLRAGLQDVSKAADAGASSADLEPLQQRIAALEQSAKTASAEIAKATASDTAARLALSAASLRDAVLRGSPFAAELAQVKALGADDKVLAPLTPFAAAGVPSEKALATELSALLPSMIKAAGAPPVSGNFIERLQANAGQLVRIRPVDAPAGDDPSTVLARLEVDAAKADIAAALSDLGKLTDAQRAPAQGWIAKAKAREAALAAARQAASDAARSLGSR